MNELAQEGDLRRQHLYLLLQCRDGGVDSRVASARARGPISLDTEMDRAPCLNDDLRCVASSGKQHSDRSATRAFIIIILSAAVIFQVL